MSSIGPHQNSDLATYSPIRLEQARPSNNVDFLDVELYPSVVSL